MPWFHALGCPRPNPHSMPFGIWGTHRCSRRRRARRPARVRGVGPDSLLGLFVELL
jgi:hypothetical protein